MNAAKTHPLQLHEPTEAERLADRLPWVGTAVLRALEGTIPTLDGIKWVVELATIASRAEAVLVQRYTDERKAR